MRNAIIVFLSVMLFLSCREKETGNAGTKLPAADFKEVQAGGVKMINEIVFLTRT